jgi:flagellar biosynthesis protein FlhA
MAGAKRPIPGANRSAVPAWMRKLNEQRGLIIPVGFVFMLVVLLVPLPPWMMDVMIVVNIALAVVVLLTTIYMQEPLEFSVFPSLLLVTTLFRLVLNIASTRLILTADASTPEAAATVAGHVVMAFGQFVAGDSLFVGVILFLILIIVQFMVITKGATRISEVAARFTLDAMPGKQMAIDADVNAGVIDEQEARVRREKIGQEADFFGAMDGASKFVRGDAIAGLIITVINVVGGFVVGMVVRGWDAGATAKIFTMLTIGDGLSSQLPAFIIAIASALIVTRSGSKMDLGRQFTDQIASRPKGLLITAGFLGLLVFTPLPTLPLMATAGALVAVSWAMGRGSKEAAAKKREDDAAATAAKAPEQQPVEALLKVDTLELEVGVGVVPLVDTAQGGDLVERIGATRRQLATEIGLVMPPVRIRDNVRLQPGEYRVKVRGNAVATGMVRVGRLLAMDSGITTGGIQGEMVKEPAFGLNAWWIDPLQRPRAEAMNYTVVDPTSVIVTHIAEVTKKHADELLTREEVNNLIEQVKQKSPKLVEEAVPAVIKPVELQKILQNLLRERVPIRDLETILETLSEWGTKTKDLDVLTEYVRNALRRTICTLYAMEPLGGGIPKLVCVTLDPSLEDQIAAYIDRGAAGTTVTMPARVASKYAEHIAKALQLVVNAGHPPVIIASPQVRSVVRQVVESQVQNVAVLGYNEIVNGVEVESLALVVPPPGMGASGEAPVVQTPGRSAARAA